MVPKSIYTTMTGILAWVFLLLNALWPELIYADCIPLKRTKTNSAKKKKKVLWVNGG